MINLCYLIYIIISIIDKLNIMVIIEINNIDSLSNRVDETILVKELSSVRLLNSFFSCWSK